MSLFSNFFGPQVPSVSAIELNKRLSTGEMLVLLDVREPEEFTEGHIDRSVLIPLGELQRRANELPKNEPIICICASGSRSAAATQFLVGAGYNAINMNRGMMGWQMANLPIVQESSGNKQ